MSTDGGGRAGADTSRRLARRLTAAAVVTWVAAAHATRRSHALVRSRLASATASPPVMAGVTGLAGASLPGSTEPDPRRRTGLGGIGLAGTGLGGTGLGGTGLGGSGPRPEADGHGAGSDRVPEAAERRLGPAILTAADSQVPALLRNAAAWSWRLLLVAAIVYLSFKVAVALRLLVLPFIAAILLCALLQPLTARLARAGLPRLAATWATLLGAIGVLAGIGVLIANQVQAGYPRLSAEVVRTVRQVLRELSGPPFRLNGARLDKLSSKLVNYLEQHKTVVAGTVLTGGKYFLEVLVGLILTIFITFFLLKDGDVLWARLMRGFERFRGAGPASIERSKVASNAAWQALVRYIHGTTIIAVIHAVLIGIALWLLGVPLIMPIAILVFIAAYVPLVGILVVGALAILVTLATQGWLAALILLAVFLVENQLESHLLQPLIIGRAVRLHPLEIIIVLAIGGIVAGIPGAIVAVPTAAVVSAAWRSGHESRRRDSSADRPRPQRAWGRKDPALPGQAAGSTAAESTGTEANWAQDSVAKGDDAGDSSGSGGYPT
jgi:predicted PurR-regulated permease PerM